MLTKLKLRREIRSLVDAAVRVIVTPVHASDRSTTMSYLKPVRQIKTQLIQTKVNIGIILCTFLTFSLTINL